MNDKPNNGIVIQKKHILIAVILMILFLAGGVVVGINWNSWFGKPQLETTQLETSPPETVQTETETETETETSPKPALDIDPNAGSWNGEKPQDRGGEEVGIKIPGYPSITIAKDTENVTMALLNPEGNPCYFKFEIVLKDSGETIFESKYVPPGEAITDVTLTKPLAEGEYNATIMITTIALDQETPLNGANVETVLIAK